METKIFSKVFLNCSYLKVKVHEIQNDHIRHIWFSFYTNIVNSTTSPNIGKGCSSGNRPSSGHSFSGRTITYTEFIESLTSLSPPLTIGFSRLLLLNHFPTQCSISQNFQSNCITIQSAYPINLFNGNCPSVDIQLWFYPNVTGIYTIGISKQKGIKLGYLNATPQDNTK